MSKNVAVFIDVANIFYAAKAAGVDIDYVQLLKTATAGRDLVRAYAYTGLDPENDNQKQFHSFLGRHGYRVVSKDIRKYGDGRVKANLDIELVVDMMRTASNLDIAVVVSGDGDFAPAIRAVQDLGVRVEVISFRANTSSDLIDVADVFTDIREIARVDKGSSRSGRRVASDEEDLSMTAVPEKESEGPARRRRGGRGRGAEREEGRREPAALSEGAGLVALPGEKLSHGAAGGRSNGTSAAEAVEATAGPTEGHEAETDGEGRRRRRRRGGRGRGRGRERERGQELAEVSTGTAPEEEDEDLPDFEPPRLPASSTFGSVWDSQIGMTPPANVPGGPIDETYEDEPEIPEYLIAERRQRGRGPRVPNARPPRRGRGGAYQAAVERERYGGARTSLPTPPFSSGRAPSRGSEGRSRERRPGDAMARGSGGEEPWSEVPPEVAELLRAELARKRSTPPDAGTTEASSTTSRATEAPEAPARRTRGRGSATASRAEGADVESATPAEGESSAPRRRTTRSRSATPAGTEAPEGGAAVDASAAPARRTTRRRTPVPAEEGSGNAAGVEAAEAAQPKPRRTRRSARPEAEAPGD